MTILFVKKVLLFLWYTGPIVGDSVDEANAKLVEVIE